MPLDTKSPKSVELRKIKLLDGEEILQTDPHHKTQPRKRDRKEIRVYPRPYAVKKIDRNYEFLRRPNFLARAERERIGGPVLVSSGKTNRGTFPRAPQWEQNSALTLIISPQSSHGISTIEPGAALSDAGLLRLTFAPVCAARTL